MDWLARPPSSLVPPDDLLTATFVTLTVTEQKNGVRDETIGHGRSGHPHLCPVLCTAVRVLALRTAGAAVDSPLNASFDPTVSHFRFIIVLHLTTTRIRAAIILHPDPAYTLRGVSIRSTHAGGAMELICAGIAIGFASFLAAGGPTRCIAISMFKLSW